MADGDVVLHCDAHDVPHRQETEHVGEENQALAHTVHVIYLGQRGEVLIGQCMSRVTTSIKKRRGGDVFKHLCHKVTCKGKPKFDFEFRRIIAYQSRMSLFVKDFMLQNFLSNNKVETFLIGNGECDILTITTTGLVSFYSPLVCTITQRPCCEYTGLFQYKMFCYLTKLRCVKKTTKYLKKSKIKAPKRDKQIF